MTTVQTAQEPRPAEQGAAEPQKAGVALYWIWFHVSRAIWKYVRRHPIFFTVAMVLIVGGGFFFRPLWHHGWMAVRMHLSVYVAAIVLVGLELFWGTRRGKLITNHAFRHILATLAVAGTLAAFVEWGVPVQSYVAHDLRYRGLDITELKTWPYTDHERLLPHTSMYVMAQEKVTDSNQAVAEPDYVRVGDHYDWTLGVGPSYLLNQVFSGSIDSIFDISATSALPNWSHRVPVHFKVGEQLRLAHNTETCTIRAMGFSRFFSYEPADVRFIPDDSGKWVQIVSLVRWSGFFFPTPEFGGVVVIQQQQATPWVIPLFGIAQITLPDFSAWLSPGLVGCGSWIPPEEVRKYPYLAGQNLLPQSVSRYIAQSFRFQNGFTGPLIGNHTGDVRIPDLPADVNPQPFTTFFKNVDGKGGGKLYHFFSLEPYGINEGLAVALFVPADGGSRVYALHPSGLTGVSAVAGKVRASQTQIDWNNSHPAEHRPYVREINGKPRLFWMTTVVTKKDTDRNESVTAGIPLIALTDAETNIPVWVDPLHPDTWPAKLQAALAQDNVK